MRAPVDLAQTDTLAVARKVRLSYWLAVLLIASLAAASYWIMDREIRGQSADKELIFLAGEQTMLSQRIMALTQAAHDTDQLFVHAAVLNELRERVAAFEANHAKLLDAINVGGGLRDGAQADMTALLTKPPYDIDFYAREIVKNARSFVARSVDPPQRARAIPLSLASASAALAGYSRISDLLSQNARATAAETGSMYRALFAAMMLVLAATVLFIFRPMINSVAQRTNELMKARNEMAYLAAHDRLTGLRNRVFLTDHFEHMIENAKRRRERVAVLHLDLDNFKSVNDTYGHMAGDHVLKEVSARIKTTVRAADIPSRIGGDEFVILLNNPG
ncbi:MAG: diguanylate cyclase, partial [Oricola sp.]